MEDTENKKTNRPVLPGVEEMLTAARKVQSTALAIQESTENSVENVDACLSAIDDMESFLKEFFAGQSSMIETRAKTDMSNLQELVRVQTESMKVMRKAMEASRKAFTDDEYVAPKDIARLNVQGVQLELDKMN